MKYLRNIASVILGLAVGAIVIFFIESAGHDMFSAYNDVPDLSEEEAFAEFVANLPLKAFLLLLLAHFTGSLVGGFLSNLFANTRRFTPALATGVLFSCAGAINLINIPHPTWFAIADMLMYIPASYIGFKIYLTIVTDPR